MVLPQTRFDVISVEWPTEEVIDQPHLRNADDLAKWLRRLTDYWRSQTHTRDEAPKELVQEVRELLRPEFERVPSLAYRVDAAIAVMDRLTDDQYRNLDIIEGNPRILLDGGAGTGKTFLGVEIAKRASARGLRVGVTAWSPTLTAYLRSRLPPPIDVVAFGELERDPDREPWDYLVVDEAQDVMTLDELVTLDGRVKGGLEKGRWCFFYDSNNQSGVAGHRARRARDPENLGPTTGQLRWNC